MRQQNPPVDLPRRATVENRGFLEIGRQRAEELPHQVGTERATEQSRHDHRPRRIHPPHDPHENELWDDGHRQRHHQSAQVQDEQRIAAPELQSREGITGQRAEEDLPGGDTSGIQHGVEEHPPERHQREHLAVVGPLRMRREQRRLGHLAVRLQGARQRPDDREQRAPSDPDQSRVQGKPTNEVAVDYSISPAHGTPPRSAGA
ncbi:Uncharacterised protein [Mycobacterium tuberculosis]|uniref:Uncharacterized protein n=1 Tax=Mycobacterium tuberculosis TaxID=1773 RepID=A0A654ZID7_MYCTX|nr:Uncharacterised protein [Mycobacterium tuberculosis]CKR24106.1 Uncharacterised protein [Mycobacterium tuberculosis]COW93932.1 Uncharacterised protein [Mycobacterium tuberculosis]